VRAVLEFLVTNAAVEERVIRPRRATPRRSAITA